MRSIIFALLFGLTVAGAVGAEVTGSLVGTVTNHGALMPGVTIRATNVKTGLARTTVTDAEGLFSFHALAVGDYKVAASLEGFTTRSASARVTPGQSAAVSIDLNGPEPIIVKPRAGTVEGTVKSKKEGGAVPGAALVFIPVGGGDRPNTTSNDKGVYVRDYLAPGMYEVTCTAQGYNASTKRVTVLADKKAQLDFELVKK